ncbi:MAG: membrane protein insertase YidC, partial [Pseudomonadota bacterium]|nr:membrane protein insertase YidC [Pseudomonadota bacterium]
KQCYRSGGFHILEIIADSPRIDIKTDRLSGSIRLAGGRIDDLLLVDHFEDMEATTPVTLFSPAGAAAPYYADFGWIAPIDTDIKLPGPGTLWQTDAARLTTDTPVTLFWDNGQGLTFERRFAVDDNYLFTVTRRVVNASKKDVTLYPFGRIARHGTPESSSYFILHEGLIGMADGELREVKYKDMKKKGRIKYDAGPGWIGMTDKYWLSALLVSEGETASPGLAYHRQNNQDRYQAELMSAALTVPADKVGNVTDHLFAGAKEVKVLDGYEKSLGVEHLDLAIDFGWYYFMTKPFLYCLVLLKSLVGNCGIAILIFTIFVRGALFPLANKSYTSMSKMKKLQPQMTELREKFGQDRERLQQELLDLYKREKVNPLAGCLPMLIQIPIFFSLYKVLFVSIETRHEPFFGWIKDLSAPDPTSIFNMFGILPFDAPDFLPALGVWPVLMGMTMFIQQRLSPKPSDPAQAKMMMFLPIVFTFLLGRFAAGLVIYWTWSNILSTIQQWVILRRVNADNAK